MKINYPLTSREIITAPSVFSRLLSLRTNQKLKLPSRKTLKDFAIKAGVSHGNFRTTLSRMVSNDELVQVTKDNIQFFDIGSMGRGMMNNVFNEDTAIGYTVAIYSFTAKQTASRQQLRDMLHYYGFKKLASNVYINKIGDYSTLIQSVKKKKLMKNLYIFSSNELKDSNINEKVMELWDYNGWTEKIKKFDSALDIFFSSMEKQTDDEIYFTILYAGTAFYNHLILNIPPFPQKLNTQGSILSNIQHKIEHAQNIYADKIIKYIGENL